MRGGFKNLAVSYFATFRMLCCMIALELQRQLYAKCGGLPSSLAPLLACFFVSWLVGVFAGLRALLYANSTPHPPLSLQHFGNNTVFFGKLCRPTLNLQL